MIKLLEIALESFWHFVGVFMILGLIGQGILEMWRIFWNRNKD